MRRRAPVPPDRSVQIDLDGEPVSVVAGEPLALGLLAAGQALFSRSIKYHRPRGAFCLEGSCGNCLLRVDGLPNVFSCRTPARSGMRVERQNVFPSAKLDIFAAVDLFFPGGLDHHHLMAGVPIAEDVMARVTRQLAGTGQLPASAMPIPAPVQEQRVRLAVVGTGTAGTGATRWLQTHAPGGSWLAIDREQGREQEQTALGVYQDEPGQDGGGRFLLVRTGTGRSAALLKLRFERLILAPGGHSPLLAFENNDLPGIHSAAAIERLLQAGIVPGERLVLVGEGAPLLRMELALRRAGVSADATLPLHASSTLRAHGGSALSAVSFQDASGREQRRACDALALCLPRAPRFELAHQAGVPLRADASSGGFFAEADGEGRTAVSGVLVAGCLGGFEDAEASGARAARAAWEGA